jgi:hypothetical protein
MAKRPQKRSGELSAPQLQQTVFDVTSQPVNTAIDPGAAGAPAKPVMQQDAVRPDLGPAQDMARMGQALSGLSSTVRDLATLEELRTQEAQKDAERLVAETDLSIAELVDQGKLTGVTPAHIRGRGRALANQEALNLANEYEATKTALRTTEGSLEPDYMEKWLRKTAEERRASLRMAGVNEGYFNKRFNENFGRLVQKVNADHNAWAGKEHQSRAVSDAKDSLITLAKTVPYDPSSDNSQLYDAMYDLIEGRVDGRMTRRGTNIAIGQSAVDIMVEDPSMIPTMEFVLDNMPTGPILLPESFDPTTSIRNKLGLPTDDSRKGRLGKIAEVSNYRNEKQGRIDSAAGTRRTQVAKQEFQAFEQGLENSVRDAAANLLATSTKATLLDLTQSKGGSTALEFAKQVIASDPNLLEYFEKGDIVLRPIDGGKVEVINNKTQTRFTLDAKTQFKNAREQVREVKTRQGRAIQGTTEQSVRVNVSIEMGTPDPESINIMANGVTLLTRSSAEMATLINNLPNIEGVRADPSFEAFMKGYREHEAYDSQGLSGYLGANESLRDATFIYDVYRHMTTMEGHTPEGAFAQIIRAVANQDQFQLASSGLREQMERQMTPEQLAESSDEVKELATMYLFMRSGSNASGDVEATPTTAIEYANEYIKKNYVHLGGTRIRISSLAQATEQSLGPNSEFAMLQTAFGERNGTDSDVAAAFNSGSPAVEELFGKEFIASNAPDGRMNITRFEPVSANDFRMGFRVFQNIGGLAGERQVMHPDQLKRPDGSFTMEELLEVSAVELPGLNADTLEEAARKQKIKVERLNLTRPRILIRLLSKSEIGHPVVEQYFAMTEGGKSVTVEEAVTSGDPDFADLIDKKPWMMYFFSTEGSKVFDRGQSEPARFVGSQKIGSLRSRIGSGEIPSVLGRAFMDPEVLLEYQRLTPKERETVPDLDWMGDLDQSVPSMFKLRREGILDGGIPRTLERIGNAVVDFTGQTYGTRSLLSAIRSGDADADTLLLADLLQASPEGRAYLKSISEKPFSTEVDLSKAMTMEAADKFLYEFTDEQRETLGRRFDFFYDPRFIALREEKENEQALNAVEAEAQRAAQEIAEGMNK